MLPELAELGSDTEFTGRRIAAFSFIGDRYATSQWNEMEVKVLKLLCELEPAKIHSLVNSNTYPGTAFRGDEAQGFSQITSGVYVKTNSSTSAKIDLLKRVFEVCDISASELAFEMPVGAELD